MNRRVVVIGATGGIGSAASLLLATHSASMVLAGRRAAALDDLAARCAEAGCKNTTTAIADLSNPGTAEKLVGGARDDGQYPVLVYCAGAAAFGDLSEMGREEIDAQIRINLGALIESCRALIPWAVAAGGGQVVIVLSIASTHVFPGSAVYCGSKAGALMFTRCLSKDYRSIGLRVTSLIPGSTDTPLWEGKAWRPPADDMLPAAAVAEAIRDAVLAPADRNVDEIVLMPPKGIL